MKIAIFHELDFGGARRVVSEFSKRLNEFFEVDFYYVDEKEDRNINKYVKRVYYYPFYSRAWKGRDWRVRLYKDTIELVKLYKLHKKIALDIKLKKYDYIFVHPSKFTQAPFLLRFLKNKCIYFCQEPLRIVYDDNLSDISGIKFPKNIYEFVIRKIRKWIDKENFKNAAIVLANSNYSKKFIEKSYDEPAKVCCLGVDIDFFKPSGIAKTIDVLFIGNNDDTYNLLNDALALFKTNKPNFYTIFRQNKKINFSDEEFLKIYNKSKVLVALNRNEPFGLIPLEAMSCGVPVIAVDEGGYRESVINNKTGFLIPRDSKELYKKINIIISDDKLRQGMGKNARENILKNWTWDKSVGRFLRIIKYGKYKN